MSKANKYAKQAAALSKLGNDNKVTGGKKSTSLISTPTVEKIALSVGNHQFRVFRDLLDDAKFQDYPKYEDIPEEFRRDGNVWKQRAMKVFYSGARVSDLGLDYDTPQGVNSQAYWVSVKTTLQCLLQSFEPAQEVKMATVAWCLSAWFKEL